MMKNRNNTILNKLKNLDIISIIIIIVLLIIGLLSIYSATIFKTSSDSTAFIKQLIWIGIGTMFFLVIYSISKTILLEYAVILYVLGIFLIVVPFFTSGVADSTYRWINIGFLHLQPSEIMKFILIIMLAKYFTETNISKNSFLYIVPPLFITLLPMAIILKQPDLGNSLILVMIFGGMLFSSGVRLYYIFLLIAPIITIFAAFNPVTFFIWGVLLAIIIFINHSNILSFAGIFIGNVLVGIITPVVWNNILPYQQQRILTMFNPNLDPQNAGYQAIQSKIAIGSGGFWGKGYLNGTQTHLKFLPEQHTDFIFSVIAEELGFIVVFFILVLFFTLFYRWYKMALKTYEKFSAMLIIGGTTTLLFHVFINIGMTIGLLPVTGKPLPFLSYGGSFLLTCFGLAGLILNGNTD
ncbi:MAG: rod shape-determining protein RodA [Candidatus Marinimicrobia bacterium]|nr:rod shape-determining protein RodA [Candidatus Neomarinimicrobiota bacterium]